MVSSRELLIGRRLVDKFTKPKRTISCRRDSSSFVSLPDSPLINGLPERDSGEKTSKRLWQNDSSRIILVKSPDQRSYRTAPALKLSGFLLLIAPAPLRSLTGTLMDLTFSQIDVTLG